MLNHVEKSLKAADYNYNDLGKVIGPLQAIGALSLMSDWHFETYENDRDVNHLLDSYKLIDQKTFGRNVPFRYY